MKENPVRTSGTVGRLDVRTFAILSIVVCLLGWGSSAYGEPAKDLGLASPAENALGEARASLSRCSTALAQLEDHGEAEGVIGEILNDARQGTLDGPAALEKIEKIAGGSLSLTSQDLATCVAAHLANVRRPTSPTLAAILSEGSPDFTCPSNTFSCGTEPPMCCSEGYQCCPEPTTPGAICCSGDDVCASQCGPEGTNCVATCESKCFPSDATVRLDDGRVKTMADLALGDRVQVAFSDGSIGYEAVYFMTHQDAELVGSYLEVDLANGMTLTLSPRHFVPTASAGSKAWGEEVLVAADELRSGDSVWHRGPDGTLARSTVREVRRVAAVGAFNPMTESGTLVVDGVVASAHSDWFLDGIASPDVQAAVYDALYLPVRVLYDIAGPEAVHTVTMEWGVVDWIRRNTSSPSGAAALLLLLLLVLAAPFVGFGVLRRRKRRKTGDAVPTSGKDPAGSSDWTLHEAPGQELLET